MFQWAGCVTHSNVKHAMLLIHAAHMERFNNTNSNATHYKVTHCNITRSNNRVLP